MVHKFGAENRNKKVSVIYQLQTQFYSGYENSLTSSLRTLFDEKNDV